MTGEDYRLLLKMYFWYKEEIPVSINEQYKRTKFCCVMIICSNGYGEAYIDIHYVYVYTGL